MPTPATTNFGNTATPGSGYFFDDFGNCQFWSNVGNFPGGIVTDMWCYVGGDGATPSAKLCIWSNSTLKWNSGSITLASSGRSVGGQSWVHVSGINLYLAPTNFNLGFWTNGNVIWTYEGSGSTNFQRSVANPATLASGGTEGSGALGVYIQYVARNGHVMRMGNMTVGQGFVMRTANFTSGTFWRMVGGVWTQGN